MARRKRRSKQFKDSSKVIDMQQARMERQQKRQEREKSVEKEPKDISPQSSARHSNRKMKLRRRKQLRRWGVVAVCAFIVIIMSFSLGQILVLKHDLHQEQKQKEKYQKQKEQLEKDIAETNDLDYLEEQARDQMRLVKPGETLYIFPEDMDKK